MDKTALYALKASIKHWRENLAAAKAGAWEKVVIHGDACALCLIYAQQHECGECPVAKSDIGRSGCRRTPWIEVMQSLRNHPADFGGAEQTTIYWIEEELKFLLSLLPEGESEELGVAERAALEEAIRIEEEARYG